VTALLPCVCLLGSAATTGAQIALLHEFAGGVNDGGSPLGSLTLSGSTLYGMTRYGGNSNNGVVFKVGADGSGYQLLHEFAGGANDGASPEDSLTLSGSTLYGTTYFGGDSNRGVIFKVGTDGSNYQLLHEFTTGPDDGALPGGSLTLSGSALWGSTVTGGALDRGVIFNIGTDGSGYWHPHVFVGGVTDGMSPRGSLSLSDSTLYGMTRNGGDSDKGVIFKVGTDGSYYQVLHEFAGGANDGAWPEGSLTVSGSTLYGMTWQGGDSNEGVIFKVGADGSSYQLLHEFAGGANDGRLPHGSLTLSGSTLYGMTVFGGDGGDGVIFEIGTDGSGYQHLHEFAGGADDGENPYGSLSLCGSTLFGMTMDGGYSDTGVVFAHPGFQWSAAASGQFNQAANWLQGVAPSNVGGVVIIRPQNGLTVTGPSGSVIMDYLRVGVEAAGVTTLDLPASCAMVVTQHTRIEAGGRLTCSGSFACQRTLHNAGEIVLSGGGNATFHDATNDGVIQVGSGCTAVFSGEVSGSGSFPGGGTVYLEGDLGPGASAAVVPFGGDVVFGSAAGFEAELAGTGAGEFDRVEIAGEATLDGTLTVALLGAFVPLPYDSFEIMTFGSRDGEFADAEGIDNVGGYAGLWLDLAYDADSLTLVAAATAGDADLDADVDFDDFATLAFHFGGAGIWTDGDFDGDGDVDFDDFTALAFNFGTTGAAAPSGSAVPEPATLLLASLGGLALLRRRRRG
jgi:uncharacterized repeat protein (TIGR03803 family)